jgi:hypothetical protein
MKAPLLPKENDVLESRDFYEVCQRYRHSQEFHKLPLMNTLEAFAALKQWIRDHCIVSVDPTVDEKWEE